MWKNDRFQAAIRATSSSMKKALQHTSSVNKTECVLENILVDKPKTRRVCHSISSFNPHPIITAWTRTITHAVPLKCTDSTSFCIRFLGFMSAYKAGLIECDTTDFPLHRDVSNCKGLCCHILLPDLAVSPVPTELGAFSDLNTPFESVTVLEAGRGDVCRDSSVGE
mmetsp:Transcript_60901/g.106105  ORF Transcript_60901/g.106105 Transcript_60901/m.106105 type:complete len:167 (+) Transcript_60901:9-509(+)